MKTLSILSTTKRISWLIVEGTQSVPVVVPLTLKRIKCSDDIEVGSGLCTLLQTFGLLLDQEKPEQIAILQPGKSKFNNTSTVRIKIEAVIQIAAGQKGIPVHLVSPISTSSFNKKLEKANTSLEALLNGGSAFSPLELKDVICTGVVKLPNV